MSLKPGTTHKLIVIQRPVLWVVGLFLLTGALLLMVWGAYEYGRYSAGYDSSGSSQYIVNLEKALNEAKAEIVETRRQASMLERNRQIDEDASKQVQQSLVKAQEEVLALKKDLAFYKSIVAPELGNRSIAIQTFELKPDSEGNFQYKLMVSQRGRNDVFARGTIKITIEGKKQGTATTLKLSDISNDTKKVMKFGFKYFQNFEGTLTLPETFKPDSVHVRVNPKSGKLKPIDEQFAWSDLTTGGA